MKFIYVLLLIVLIVTALLLNVSPRQDKNIVAHKNIIIRRKPTKKVRFAKQNEERIFVMKTRDILGTRPTGWAERAEADWVDPVDRQSSS
jgi:hypothetical protein